MNRLVISLSVTSLMLALVGCGTTPSTPALPTPKPGTVDSYVRYDIPAPSSGAASSVTPELPLEKTRAGAIEQMRAHIRTWKQEEDVMSASLDRFSNTQFGGVLLSALGAAASSVDVAKGGAAIAGGASVWTSHYQLSVQRDNYQLAGSAMACLKREVEAVAKGYWDATYEADKNYEGEMRLSRQSFVAAEDSAKTQERNAAYDTLSGLFETIHTAVDDVRGALTRKQRALSITTPKPEDIRAALTNEAKSKQSATDQMEALRSVGSPALQKQQEKLWRAQGRTALSFTGMDACKKPADETPEQRANRLEQCRAAKQVKAAEDFADIPPEAVERALKLPAALNVCVAQMK